MKLCIRCKKYLDETAFDRSKRCPGGRFHYCKDCRRAIDGRKKLIHNIIGSIDGYDIVDDVYPRVLKPGGNVRVHRYVAEKKLGRKLLKGEHVHHLDGNKKNWKINNIVVMDAGKHITLETKMRHLRDGDQIVKVRCKICGKEKEYSSYYTRTKRIKPENYKCINCYISSLKNKVPCTRKTGDTVLFVRD